MGAGRGQRIRYWLPHAQCAQDVLFRGTSQFVMLKRAKETSPKAVKKDATPHDQSGTGRVGRAERTQTTTGNNMFVFTDSY